ncbi:MAG: hypothetical protein ACRCTD_03640 [Beijerinckiaceae bacterium]
MSKTRTPTAAAVAATAAGGGITLPDATAQRIAGAIAPALKAFDAASWTLPMAQEPSAWMKHARANGLANAARKKGGRA